MKETEYLNVDLELESERDISPLAQHFADSVFVLLKGELGGVHRLSLELSCAGDPGSDRRESFRDADACIRGFLALLCDLPLPLRALWDGCTSRVFDIGIAAGATPSAFVQTVSESTVQLVSSIGGAIRVTVYAPQVEPCENV